MYILWFLVVYLTYFMKPVKETTFSSKIPKVFFANICNDWVFSVIKNKQHNYAIRVWALSSWFPFHLQITGKCNLYKFHRNRKQVQICRCSISFYLCAPYMDYVQCEQGYAVQVRHIISTNEHFWYKWSTSSVWVRYRVQARHIIKYWKREALIHCTIHWPDISCIWWTVLAYNICIQYNWKCYVPSQLRVHQGAKFPCTYIYHFLI